MTTTLVRSPQQIVLDRLHQACLRHGFACSRSGSEWLVIYCRERGVRCLCAFVGDRLLIECKNDQRGVPMHAREWARKVAKALAEFGFKIAPDWLEG
jgi:hypothetical protein